MTLLKDTLTTKADLKALEQALKDELRKVKLEQAIIQQAEQVEKAKQKKAEAKQKKDIDNFWQQVRKEFKSRFAGQIDDNVVISASIKIDMGGHKMNKSTWTKSNRKTAIAKAKASAKAKAEKLEKTKA